MALIDKQCKHTNRVNRTQSRQQHHPQKNYISLTNSNLHQHIPILKTTKLKIGSKCSKFLLLRWLRTHWCPHPPPPLAIYSLSPLRGFSATHPHFFTSHTFEPASCSVHTFLTLPHTYTGHTFQLTTLTHLNMPLSGEITESLKKHAHACHGKT